MKKLISLLVFALCWAPLFAANIQIENITTTVVLPGSNDYGVMSGTTRGTNKILMSRFTYLTATRTTLAALSITGAFDGTGIVVLGGSAAGDGNGAIYFWSATSTATPNGVTVILPASAPGTGRWLISSGSSAGVFTTITASGQISANSTVDATSPSAGSIVTLGGIGVTKSINVGGSITTVGAITNTSSSISTVLANDGSANGFIGTTTNHGLKLGVNSVTIGLLNSAGLTINGQITSTTDMDVRLAPTQGAVLKIGRNPTGNFNSVVQFLASTTQTNWQLSHNSYVAGAFEITPSTTGGGSTFTTPLITLSTTAMTMGANKNIVLSGTGKITATQAPSSGSDLANKTYVDSVASGTAYVINVKAYGAVGDGVTNDTTAINAAIAAMTSRTTLYFPAGSYLVTPGSVSAFSSMSYINVRGDGIASRITSTATGAPGNFLVFNSSCDHVNVQDMAIVGSATTRGSGIGIRMYASGSVVSNVYISGTSDFGFLFSNGGAAYTIGMTVVNCVADHTLGDGFHFGAVTDATFADCRAYYTGDDGVGIGDDGAIGFPCTRLEVVGFQSIQAGNHSIGGTHGSGIRIFDGAVDIHITGGAIYQSCEAGLQTTRATSTTAYNTRIKVDGLRVYQCLQNAGMYGQINFSWVNQGSITNCWSEAPLSQCCYAFLDCNNLTVTGNTAKDAVVRAFVTDDGTTTNVASTWSNWTFSDNACLGTPSNESYYFVPATGKTIANLIVTGNTETGQSTANYIYTNRIATAAKVNNNTSLGGKAVANGGSGVVPTLANNN